MRAWARLGEANLKAAFVGLAFAVTMAARLFVSGPVGLSNQGDGSRLMCWFGLSEGTGYANLGRRTAVELTWSAHRWYGQDCGEGVRYLSSELVPVKLSMWGTHLFGLGSGLDLRVLAVVNCVILGTAAALLFRALPGPQELRLAITALLWLVFADGTFAGYLMSAYSEPAMFAGLLFVIAAVCWYWRSSGSVASLLSLVASAVFALTAKTQAVTLLVGVLPLLLLRSRLHNGRAAGETWTARLRSGWRGYLPGAGAALVVLMVAALHVGATPARVTEQNRYNAVFLEMLPHSSHPGEDLRNLGLDPSLAAASGKTLLDSETAAARPEYSGLVDKATPLRTTMVYLREPLRFASLLGRGLDGMARFRPDYIYSYPASEPGRSHLECRVCFVEQAWTTVFLPSPWLIFVLVVVSMAGGALAVRKGASRGRQAMGVVALFLGGEVVAQFWAVMLTEGSADLVKHLALANLLTCAAAVFGLASWLIPWGVALFSPPRERPARRRGSVEVPSDTEAAH
ncbi:glycan biosynthesis hexose transferase WsfD [Pedococcus sp. 5OH_020]|uniref:glycan biosynthesis hexose transferase WsfD n=1 Tax=Pedococcus sp. 5OH_020 TaxID=2989814 RepID=UPI0022EA0BFA|nr:hypothetical protein [Pedococcus sp. 5OH_020]